MNITTLEFLGHSTVVLKTEKSVIAIDPWLHSNPSCPENKQNLDRVDAVILTHGHSDHAGDAVGICKKHGSKVYATFELAQLLIKEGVPEQQVIAMNKGGTAKFEEISITLTYAFHSNSYTMSSGETCYAGEACGVVISDGKTKIYHAGDTALFSDMKLIAELYQPTLALLPIGDCYTMDPKQASIACRMLEVQKVIPIHWGTFPALTGTPKEFEAELKDSNIEVITLQPGEGYSLG